jgi:nicotinate (nicotinamide) nucleotide adenylyltransferase
MKRIAFYGGSFDPLHCGHLTIARALTEQFELDRFVFIPAFHAPHKLDKKPTSPFHRFAMLALATNDEPKIEVSTIELEMPEKPYTFETLTRLKSELSDDEIFFVMGADSWLDITTWREWETVLTLTNTIVMTRPDYPISFDHVTDEIRSRIVDLRGVGRLPTLGEKSENENPKPKIYISDAVKIDISATEIRESIRRGADDWRASVPETVAGYIEKYGLYLK